MKDCRNITIPLSTAVIASAIHSILSAAVDMYRLLPAYEGGIVFTGESSKYDTSRGRPNKHSKMRGENRCFVLK